MFFRPLAAKPVLWPLLLVSAIAGVLALFIFEKFAKGPVRERASRQLWASLLAIRLFADDPHVVARSFASLIWANAVLVGSAIPPALLLTALFLVCYGHLDAFFGTSTLAVNTRSVLTVRLNKLDGAWPNLSLVTPDWIAVDSPPVHVFDDKEISWSIRPTRAAQGTVRVLAGRNFTDKIIDSRPGPRYFSRARERSLAGALRYPGEKRLPAGLISSISISTPAAAITCCGVSLEWPWWVTIMSAAFAFVSGRIAPRRWFSGSGKR